MSTNASRPLSTGPTHRSFWPLPLLILSLLCAINSLHSLSLQSYLYTFDPCITLFAQASLSALPSLPYPPRLLTPPPPADHARWRRASRGRGVADVIMQTNRASLPPRVLREDAARRPVRLPKSQSHIGELLKPLMTVESREMLYF